MKQFIRNNREVFAFFCVSIIMVLLYLFTPIDENNKTYKWFGFMGQLSIGYVINFAFFVTQVYIPRLKQCKLANECIQVRIKGIINNMQGIFTQLGCKYIDNYSEDRLTEETMQEMVRKLNLGDRISVINASRAYSPIFDEKSYFTVQEWILTRTKEVEDEIDKLFQYYAQYITPELTRVLDKIIKSSMHQTLVKTYFQIPNLGPFNQCNDFFLSEYYSLMKDLESINNHTLD